VTDFTIAVEDLEQLDAPIWLWPYPPIPPILWILILL
jgi:hypothetical protein